MPKNRIVGLFCLTFEGIPVFSIAGELWNIALAFPSGMLNTMISLSPHSHHTCYFSVGDHYIFKYKKCVNFYFNVSHSYNDIFANKFALN